jgi:hypothetical protein
VIDRPSFGGSSDILRNIFETPFSGSLSYILHIRPVAEFISYIRRNNCLAAPMRSCLRRYNFRWVSSNSRRLPFDHCCTCVICRFALLYTPPQTFEVAKCHVHCTGCRKTAERTPADRYVSSPDRSKFFSKQSSLSIRRLLRRKIAR